MPRVCPSRNEPGMPCRDAGPHGDPLPLSSSLPWRALCVLGPLAHGPGTGTERHVSAARGRQRGRGVWGPALRRLYPRVYPATPSTRNPNTRSLVPVLGAPHHIPGPPGWRDSPVPGLADQESLIHARVLRTRASHLRACSRPTRPSPARLLPARAPLSCVPAPGSPPAAFLDVCLRRRSARRKREEK